MSWLTNIFSKIGSILHSPTVQAFENDVEALIPIAGPIVSDIAALTPNRTVQEIAAAYNKYGIPFQQALIDAQNGSGLSLLNLATQVMQKNHVPTAAVSLIQTAVQLAVLAVKSKAPAAPAPTSTTAASSVARSSPAPAPAIAGQPQSVKKA